MEKLNKYLFPLVVIIGIVSCFGLFFPNNSKIITEKTQELKLGVNSFPTSLNTWSSGETISSAWANALESKIGADNSAVTTSHDYLIRAIIGTSTMTGLTSAPNLATIGTITSGTWQGTSIADAYIANDITASNYLDFISWYATTTDILDEGLTNLYYTPGRVYAILSATTSLPLLTDIGTISNLDFTYGSGTALTVTNLYGTLTGTASGNLTSADVDTLAELNALMPGENVASTTANLSVFTNDAGFITSSTTLFTFTSGWGASLSLTGVLDWNTSTTTGENGIDITTGCYAINGTCITGGGSGSGTVSSGTPGYIPYYADYGTTLTPTSTVTINTDGTVDIGSGDTVITTDSDGNVGIGTTSPNYKFDLYGNERIDGQLIIHGDDTATSSVYGNLFHGNSAGNHGCYWIYGATNTEICY